MTDRHPEPDRLLDELHVGGVVEVHDDVSGAVRGDTADTRASTAPRASVVHDGVLGDLQHDGSPELPRLPATIGLGVLELDDVEGAQRRPGPR
ncbi:MAG: hypothetical protein WKF83_05710 [Nocardioidaceae bacterium]